MEFIDYIQVTQVERVVMNISPYKPPVDGTLCITGHQLILSPKKGSDELFQLLHQTIDCVEKRPSNIIGGSIILKCKDFRIIKLDIANTEDLHKVTSTIDSILNIVENNVIWLYPFFYRSPKPINDNECLHKHDYEINLLNLNDEWRLTSVNKDFDICPSYPPTLIVPKNVTDEIVIASAKFRSGGRFPVLSYRHNNGSVLIRSSQPLVGSSNKRCKEDEKLLNSVLGIGKRGFIIDTRGQVSKKNNQGYESQAHYPQWRRSEKPIERPQALLDSLAKLIDVCHDKNISMDNWVSKLEKSNWLTHVRDALNCACLTAQCLEQDASPVLVHGSDGRDSTLLVTSLVQIILNPDCRTMKGFQKLIEREWLQAGYPFQARHSHSCFSNPSKTNGATFLLFLDCVWQLQNQFIGSFEFKQSLLIILFEHSYTSEYGTFLCNCERERETVDLARKTVSIWSYLNRTDILEKYLNSVYQKNEKIIWPSVAPMSLNLWRELFLRWTIDLSREHEIWNGIDDIMKRNKELKMKSITLRKLLEDLQKEAAANK